MTTAAEERAAIVAWLRTQLDDPYDDQCGAAADEIEKGAHLSMMVNPGVTRSTSTGAPELASAVDAMADNITDYARMGVGRQDLRDRVRRLLDERLALLSADHSSVPMPAWADDADGDTNLPEDAVIKAAFPTRSGRHDLYQTAMRLVGARRSKAGLVELVNWLLLRAEGGAK